MSLGQKLKELRKQKNISRENMAMEIGLSYWALAKYENDERQPDYRTLISFADYFQVSTDYLLERPDFPDSRYLIDLSGYSGEFREEIAEYIKFRKANYQKNRKTGPDI